MLVWARDGVSSSFRTTELLHWERARHWAGDAVATLAWVRSIWHGRAGWLSERRAWRRGEGLGGYFDNPGERESSRATIMGMERKMWMQGWTRTDSTWQLSLLQGDGAGGGGRACGCRVSMIFSPGSGEEWYHYQEQESRFGRKGKCCEDGAQDWTQSMGFL